MKKKLTYVLKFDSKLFLTGHKIFEKKRKKIRENVEGHRVSRGPTRDIEFTFIAYPLQRPDHGILIGINRV